MNYREKLNASEYRAHSQLVATKIERGMRELRSLSESSPSARRRWGWELLQNAKDVHQGGGVTVQLHHDRTNNALYFRHSGKPFTADNIRFLIEQISTKDREKDEHGVRKETGKFGTGFLSTHLLSEIVKVSGVAKEPELEYKKFNFMLDRSGHDLPAITGAVTSAKESVQNLDALPAFDAYDPNALNTTFQFELGDPLSHVVAVAGIEDLNRCLAYTLIYVPEIRSVDFVCSGSQHRLSYDCLVEGTEVRLSQVGIFSADRQESLLTFATVSMGLTNVSIPVSHSSDSVSIRHLSEEIPRLFCDFPLVGSEIFHFPAVINNPHFDPTDPRDGIYLNETERGNSITENNRAIIADAIACYGDLVRCAIEQNWENIHFLADVRPLRETVSWVSQAWFQNNVADPVRAMIGQENIVTVASGVDKKAILGPDNAPIVWFPEAGKRAVREQIWNLANQWFPQFIPIREHVEFWNRLTWNRCGKLTSEQFCNFIEQTKSVSELSKQLGGCDYSQWLNEFYHMLKNDEGNTDSLINNKAVFPNQQGNFCKLATLHRDSGDIEEEFKVILGLFDSDIRGLLADEKVDLSIPDERVINRNWVVNQINALAQEKCNDRESARGYRDALNALLSWFRTNPLAAEQTFPALYSRKYLLYDEESVMENIDKAEQLEQLLADTGVEDVDALREIVAQAKLQHSNTRFPISEAILASLGITSIEEWEKALQDKDLAGMFSHESTPTKEMFIYVQSIIQRAKTNVIAHLQSLSNYDLTELEETAPTVLGGIKKFGREVQIVVRPAYSGEVIIYYSAERDVLDFVDGSELWVDVGDRQFLVTLGYILKKTQIQKFPV